jgi:hypothetical protein
MGSFSTLGIAAKPQDLKVMKGRNPQDLARAAETSVSLPTNFGQVWAGDATSVTRSIEGDET